MTQRGQRLPSARGIWAANGPERAEALPEALRQPLTGECTGLPVRGIEAANGLESADAPPGIGAANGLGSGQALPARGIEAPNGLQGAWRHCPRGN
jgi:hypothetical protein